MLRFARRLCLFLLPIALVLGVIEWRVRLLPNHYSQKRQTLEQQLDSLDILVLGSSHAQYAINPRLLPRRAFNLADVSQSLYYDTQLTALYLAKMPRLQTVIFHIDYASFGGRLADTPEAWRDFYYAQFWGVCDPARSQFALARYSRLWLYTPRVSCAMLLHAPDVAPNFQDGYRLKDSLCTPDKLTDAIGKARAEAHTAEWHNENVAENTRLLEVVLQQLAARHIRAVFITAPTCSAYRQYLRPAQQAKTAAILQYLCQKYGFSYYDYAADTRFGACDFADTDHLNERGAARFTRLFALQLAD